MVKEERSGKEIRCNGSWKRKPCGKLLAVVKEEGDCVVEIRCARCKTMTIIKK